MSWCRLPVLRILALSLLALGACTAFAQNPALPPDVMTLADVLRLARDVSPRLALERQNIAGAEANRIAAGAYPNPTISYGRFRPHGGQPTLFEGSRQEQATIDIPVLIAGQRTARVDKADNDIAAARARVAAGASSLAAEAGAAFVALLAAQEKSALLARTHEELGRLRDIVAGRAELGVASRYDTTRLDVEVGSFRTKFEDAKADIADRAGTLAALLGLPQLRPQASGALAPLALASDHLTSPRDRAANSPAVAAAMQEEKAAQSGVEVAERERWPTPSLSVGRSWTSHPYGAATFLGLSVEIPILDSRRGPVAKAEAEATAARLRREIMQAETAANLERYAGVIAARQTALQRFDSESASRLPALKEMSEQAYRLGRSSIFELLDSTRSRHELQQTRIDLIASLVEAQLRYLSTSGQLELALAGVGDRAPR